MFSRGLVTRSVSDEEASQDSNRQKERGAETEHRAEVHQEQSEVRRGASLPGLTETADFVLTYILLNAFSALTLLVGRQEGHPACENLSSGVLAWLSVWS